MKTVTREMKQQPPEGIRQVPENSGEISLRKRILVADNQRGLDRTSRVFSSLHALVLADTLLSVKQHLIESGQNGKSKFDLVIVGTHFDESRLIDLLQYIRTFDHFEQLPFLPIQAAHSRGLNSLALSKNLQLLGSYPLVELANLAPESSDRMFLEAVTNALTLNLSVATQRMDGGASPHIDPEKAT